MLPLLVLKLSPAGKAGLMVKLVFNTSLIKLFE